MIFFDLETTGVDTQNDRIVQICVKKGDEIKTMLINPEMPISPGASEVHGITEWALPKVAFRKQKLH